MCADNNAMEGLHTYISMSLNLYRFLVINACMRACVTYLLYLTFTPDSEVSRPQTLHDEVQEEALLR